jgi:hypothetical protein
MGDVAVESDIILPWVSFQKLGLPSKVYTRIKDMWHIWATNIPDKRLKGTNISNPYDRLFPDGIYCYGKIWLVVAVMASLNKI